MEEKVSDDKKHELVLMDYLTIGLSSLSLLISIATASISLLIQTEDVRLVVSGFPPPVVKTEEAVQVPSTHLGVVLINLGNRPVVALSITIAYINWNEPYYGESLADACDNLSKYPRGAVWLSTSFRPTVLKEKEATTTSFNITGSVADGDKRVHFDESKLISIDMFEKPKQPEPGQPNPYIDLLGGPTKDLAACLLVAVATPSSSYHQATLPLAKYSFRGSTNPFAVDDEPGTAVDKERPRVLVHKIRTMLDDLVEKER